MTITVLAMVVAIQAVVIGSLLIYRARRAPEEREQSAREESLLLRCERAPVMLWSARPDTTLDYVNQTCADFTGRPIEQLLNEGWLDALHPDDLEPAQNVYMPAVEARRPFGVEYRMRRADGTYRWILASGVPTYRANGEFSGYVGADVDITTRKVAEQSMQATKVALEESHRQIRALAGQLIEAQDAERARIARDLHDDVSQRLAGMSIAFSGLRQHLEEAQADTELQEEMKTLHRQTTTLAQSVRHLSHDLHPTVLRHAGLVPALTAYCREVERTHGLAVRCTADGDLASLDSGAALCLYRVAQEALRNVIAHAGAAGAEVLLARNGDVAELMVADDGRGFDVGSLERRKGLGLVSINERTRLAGGTATVVSTLGNGTRVSVRIPAIVGRAAVALAILFASSVPAWAQRTDIVMLLNGDRITGEVKELDRGRLEFKTDDAGTILFEWDKVTRVESSRQFEVTTSDGRRILGSLGRSNAPSVLVIEGASPATLPLLDVTSITQIGASVWARLDGSVDAGFTYSTSSAIAQLNLNTDTVFHRPAFLFQLTGSMTMVRKEEEDQRDDRGNLDFSDVRYLGRQWFGAGAARLESNESLGLTLRSQVGGWFGLRAVNTNRARFEVGAGLVLNNEDNIDSETTQNIEGLVGLQASYYTYDRPKTNLDMSADYYPSLSEWGRQRLEFSTAVKREVWKDFFAGFNLYDTFDSAPPSPGAARNDFGVVVSLGWTY